ncbi:MAG: EAL domain-containing protein [Nocardioidaceae bacterium]|nr:EAL domain-containing protein [Nocardioidaceae bacterium]NUS52044.1 EAL domain-containing protein [Nocardioidaceae bacterium]
MRAPGRLEAAMFAALAAYLLALGVPALPVPDLVRDGVLGNLVLVLPISVLVRYAAARPTERRWALVLAVGLCLYLFGNVLYFGLHASSSVQFPSPADVGYLGTYPFLLVALLVALREQLRGLRLNVALDGLTGLVAGAALTSWVIAPLIARVWGDSLTAAATLAYPVCSVVVVSATLGAVGIVGRQRGPGFLAWAAGLVVFGAGDIVYAYQLAYGSYAYGTLLDGSWAVGVAMMAYGACRLADRPRANALPGTRSLLVVTVASVTSVLVLAAAPTWHENYVPSVLALLALAGCGLRFLLAFVQLREMAAIRAQALTDELTGCANRRALYAELDRMFEGAGRDAPGSGQWAVGNGFALALVDLDHFKEVNDSFGHAAGDDLLRAVVSRFSRALEELKTPHLLARLGGDEFAVVLHDAGSRNAALACASALQESLTEPVQLHDVVLHAQASIGVATAPLHAQNRADMLFAADAAMYASKTSGEPVSFHSPEAVGDRRRRLEVAEDLFTALDRRELSVEYQPVVTGEGELVAAEALVRWDHPRRGRLSPAEFLPSAERYRLTPAIAERVLDVSLGDLARWRAAGKDLTVAVNVSASDLRDEGLVKIVASALLRHEVPPEALTIEITETAMMRDPEQAMVVMRALDDLGVRLAVDDYGTGYSSLEYLLTLPISEIKLDRAFSKHVVTELRATAIVRSTIDLTHALGLRMVAEGVEDEGTLFILRELGCDRVQGWYLGRPMAASAFETLLARGGRQADRLFG